MKKYHEPVLLKESIDALITDVSGTYVDATFGGGGHSKEILNRLGKNGKVIAFDQDEDAMKNAIDDNRFTLIRSNFRYLKNFSQYSKMDIDGVLADLGISSHQVDEGERGFSTRFDAALDMRMNRGAKLNAYTVVNEYPAEKLQQIFSEYGEIKNARSVARRIVEAREIKTTKELIEVLSDLAERGAESKFFARLFQAIRIEVNQELEALKEFLNASKDVLKKDGKLVVISYHSLEDRIVKNFFSESGSEKDVLTGQRKKPAFEVVNKKPIEPSENETGRNPRARSAKMRIAVKN